MGAELPKILPNHPALEPSISKLVMPMCNRSVHRFRISEWEYSPTDLFYEFKERIGFNTRLMVG